MQRRPMYIPAYAAHSARPPNMLTLTTKLTAREELQYFFNQKLNKKILLLKTIFTLGAILIFFTSCPAQDGLNASTFFSQYEEDIKTQIDSANYYYDLVLKEHHTANKDELKIDLYGLRISEIRNNLNTIFKEIQYSSRSRGIRPSEFDSWSKNIDLSSLRSKNEKVIQSGIDFTKLPVTDFYDLDKSYIDSIHFFSLNLPSNWVVNHVTGHSFMANGTIGTDPNIDSNTGAIGLYVIYSDQDKDLNQFYQNNITTIKEEVKDVNIVEEQDIQIDGIPAKYVALHFTYNEVPASTIQVYFTKSNTGYNLNGSITKADFEAFRYLFIEVLRTFKWSIK